MTGGARTTGRSRLTPPVSTAEKRRQRRNRVLLVAGVGVAAVVLVAGGFTGVRALVDPCEGGLQSKEAGECYGITDGGANLHPALADVEGRIKKENDAVVAGSEPVVTVALLTPVPSRDGAATASLPRSSASLEQVRGQIEGAYVAQHAANSSGHSPKLRLVIAGEGVNERRWAEVVPELKQMVGAQDQPPLVAVTGMGVSTRETVDGARALSGIPMVGSVLTANDLNAADQGIPGLMRVSPDNAEEVDALFEYLNQYQPAPARNSKKMSVFDNHSSDSYTNELRKDFEAKFSGDISENSIPYDGGAPGVGNLFQGIGGNVCRQDGPDTILYAGRANVFKQFVEALDERGCSEPVTVVTGSDGSKIQPSDVPPGVRVVYAALAAPEALRDPAVNPDGVRVYEDFEREFTVLFGRADLANGWAIMNHDALTAVSTAIQNLAGQGGDARDVLGVKGALQQLSKKEGNQTTGAGGHIEFDPTTGKPVGRRIDVMEIRSGEPAKRVVHTHVS